MNRPVIVLGGGGHAAVIVEVLLEQSYNILGYTAPLGEEHGNLASGILWIGTDVVICEHPPDSVWLVNGIGSTGVPQTRRKIYEDMVQRGYEFANVVHSNAIVSPSVPLGWGAQIRAGAVGQAGTVRSCNVICHTRAIVDPHTIVEPDVP